MQTRRRRTRRAWWQQYGPLPILVGGALVLVLVVLVGRMVINALDSDDDGGSQDQAGPTARPSSFEDVTLDSYDISVLIYEALRANPALSSVRVQADPGGFFLVTFRTSVYGSRVEGTVEVFLFPAADRSGVTLTDSNLRLPGVSPPAELSSAITDAVRIQATAELNQRLADRVGESFRVEDIMYGVQQVIITVSTG